MTSFVPPSTQLPPMVIAWARQHSVTKKRKGACTPPQPVSSSPIAKRTRLSLQKSRESCEAGPLQAVDATLAGLTMVRRRKVGKSLGNPEE
jgi:hypothetical protein